MGFAVGTFAFYGMGYPLGVLLSRCTAHTPPSSGSSTSASGSSTGGVQERGRHVSMNILLLQDAVERCMGMRMESATPRATQQSVAHAAIADRADGSRRRQDRADGDSVVAAGPQRTTSEALAAQMGADVEMSASLPPSEQLHDQPWTTHDCWVGGSPRVE